MNAANSIWELFNQAYTGGTSLTVGDLASAVTYNFKVKAINISGASTFSNEITIITNCTITYDSAFMQPPLTYFISATEISFGIPTYTLSGCGPGETLVSQSSFAIDCGVI
jgi:hypothetical protein